MVSVLLRIFALYLCLAIPRYEVSAYSPVGQALLRVPFHGVSMIQADYLLHRGYYDSRLLT